MYRLPLKPVFVASFGHDFHSWFIRLLALRVTKIGIHGNPYLCISYTLFQALVEHTDPLKQSSIADFVIFVKDNLFWLGIVTS